MRDFLPQDKARRDAIQHTIISAYTKHGFTLIETPMMEELDRLISGVGGDNEKMAFRVLKRGLSAEDVHAADSAEQLADLGMRYDLTVPLARFYATNHANLPTVFRAIQAAPVWRAERPQKGRYRQFMQCDIDIIGETGSIAEVELLSASAEAMRAIGLSDYTVRVNDRRILEAMLAKCGIDKADYPSALISIDKLDKIGTDGVVAELAEHGFDTAAEVLRKYLDGFAAADPMAPSAAVYEALLPGIDLGEGGANLIEIVAGVSDLPQPPKMVFDPTLVRGMGYYTGAIFEYELDGVGYSVGGGGRYDGMIGRFLNKDLPAVGISIGFERIVDLAKLEVEAPHAIALLYSPDAAGDAVRLQQELVDTGHTVRIMAKPKKVATLLTALAAEGFGQFAFVDSDTKYQDLDLRELSE